MNAGDQHVGDERDDELLVVEDAVELGPYPAEHRVQRGHHRDRQVRLQRQPARSARARRRAPHRRPGRAPRSSATSGGAGGVPGPDDPVPADERVPRRRDGLGLADGSAQRSGSGAAGSAGRPRSRTSNDSPYSARPRRSSAASAVVEPASSIVRPDRRDLVRAGHRRKSTRIASPAVADRRRRGQPLAVDRDRLRARGPQPVRDLLQVESSTRPTAAAGRR